MHVLDPAAPDLCVYTAAGKLEPPSVEKDAELVRARDPNHYRRGICHGPEALFTLPKLGRSFRDAVFKMSAEPAQLQMSPHPCKQFLALKRFGYEVNGA